MVKRLSSTDQNSQTLVNLPNPTNAQDAVTKAYSDSGTQTLTNKRINPRVTTATSASSLTPDVSSSDHYIYTALATDLTINAPTGTPVNGSKLLFTITDNGTSRTLTWNAIFRAVNVTPPISTTASEALYIGAVYNSDDTKWDVIAVSRGAVVSLADGGTGASLVDPNADRILFWDDSASSTAFLTASTGLTISGTNLTVRAASETATGIIERATTAESSAGTDTARAVTPAGTQTFWNDRFLDEDNMASNSATKVASQQSIKAYTDSGVQTLTNKTINGNDNTISNISPSQRVGGFKVGSFTANNTTGTQSVTGLGFSPKYVRFRFAQTNATGSFFQMDGSTDGTTQEVVGASGTTTPAFARWSSSTNVILLKAALTNDVIAAATMTSLDSDGFTVTWTTASALEFYYDAFA